jgi:hypothetical protein
LSIAVLPAQVTSTAVFSSATVTTQAAGLTPSTSTLPAATPVPQRLRGWQNSNLSVAMASSASDLENTASAVSLTLEEAILCSGTASASLASDLVLGVASPQPVPVMVELEWAIDLPVGTTLPIVAVDVDFDGSIDLTGVPNGTTSIVLQLVVGRTFLLRSVANMNSTSPPITMDQQIALRVVPFHPTVTVFPILPACFTTSIDVEPTFVPGVSIHGNLAQVAPPIGLPFLVIGFTTSFLPSPTTPLCFLAPSLDIVVPFPTTPLILDAATLGPQQFFVQGVWLGFPPTPTTTTNAAWVRF